MDTIPQKQLEQEQERTAQSAENAKQPKKEFGGPKGPEPTRFGDWEIGGRCSDF